MAIKNYVLNGSNGYKVIKTVNTKLEPVGKTRENMEKAGIISKDIERAAKAAVVKEGINVVHRSFIAGVLEKLSIDWKPLFAMYDELRTAKSREERREITKRKKALEKTFRKEISAAFSREPDYKKLFDEQLFVELIPNCCTEEQIDVTLFFNGFHTYFHDYNEHRKDMYGSEGKHNEISYRLIDDNFPVFFANCHKLDIIKNALESESVIKTTTSFRKFMEIADSIRFPVSNSDIEEYNACLSGVYDGEVQTERGINQLINEYNQVHTDSRLPLLVKLYPNILSEREPLFTISSFETTGEIISAVRDFHKRFLEAAGEFRPYLAAIKSSGIAVMEKNYASFSHAVTGDLFAIRNAIADCCPADGKKKPYQTFSDLDAYLKEYLEEQGKAPATCMAWFDRLSGFAIDDTYRKIDFSKITNLQKRKFEVRELKEYLDETCEFYRHLSLVGLSGDCPDNGGYDVAFYGAYDKFMSLRKEFTTLYNMIRNYVTKKPSAMEKIKMYFNCSTLAAGWDINKENANHCYIFRDAASGKTFLGISNSPRKSIRFTPDSSSPFLKMYYKLIPSPDKMFPKVFFSKKGLGIYKPSEELLAGYAEKRHTKGSGNFDLDFCHEYIDFCKESILKNPDWQCFDFHFSDTSSYRDVSEFYAEVTASAYCMSFAGVKRSEIDELVEEGRLYLFELTNSRLAGKSGKKDLHDMYFTNAFTDPDFIKLNGKAAIFYRPALIDKDSEGKYITHRKGSVLVNKNTSDGTRIKDSIYMEIYNFLNGHSGKKELSTEAKKLLDSGKVVYHTANYDIIKDRRYTEEQFSFHCPLTINHKGTFVRTTEFNERVLSDYRYDDSMNILAINRGENNLLYAVLMDKKGKVIMHRDFNIIEAAGRKVNYLDKLRIRAEERQNSRYDWQAIDKIADLKEGYLSVVISEIVRLMVENNAVLVMESLSKDFKSSRACIEENIYQKFEQNMIRKLSCLIFKDRNKNEAGGLRKPYQLVPEFVSMDNTGSQFGWMFFINPAFVSRFDPDTGFANIFNFRELTNFRKKQAFFGRFDSIRMEDGVLTFRYDLSSFNKDLSGQQVVTLKGTRNLWNRETKKFETVNLDEQARSALTLAASGAPNGDLGRYIAGLTFNVPNNAFVSVLLDSFEAACASKTRLGEDYLYVSPSGESSFNGKSVDFLAAYNLGNKFRYMAENEEFHLRYTDYVNAVISRKF